jgi:hypothetical protein
MISPRHGTWACITLTNWFQERTLRRVIKPYRAFTRRALRCACSSPARTLVGIESLSVNVFARLTRPRPAESTVTVPSGLSGPVWRCWPKCRYAKPAEVAHEDVVALLPRSMVEACARAAQPSLAVSVGRSRACSVAQHVVRLGHLLNFPRGPSRCVVFIQYPRYRELAYAF